jgi:hypothetical protein
MTAPFFREDTMNDSCPTILIKTPNGPVVFNESEFDPAVHELYVESEPEASVTVSEQGGTFYLFNSDGTLAEGSAPTGYKTQAMAEKALKLLGNV